MGFNVFPTQRDVILWSPPIISRHPPTNEASIYVARNWRWNPQCCKKASSSAHSVSSGRTGCYVSYWFAKFARYCLLLATVMVKKKSLQGFKWQGGGLDGCHSVTIVVGKVQNIARSCAFTSDWWRWAGVPPFSYNPRKIFFPINHCCWNGSTPQSVCFKTEAQGQWNFHWEEATSTKEGELLTILLDTCWHVRCRRKLVDVKVLPRGVTQNFPHGHIVAKIFNSVPTPTAGPQLFTLSPFNLHVNQTRARQRRKKQAQCLLHRLCPNQPL